MTNGTRTPPSPWHSRQVWHPPRQRCRLHPPASMADWLYDAGSLTGRLVRLARGRFHVEVLAQYRGLPALEERRRLRLRPGRHVLIREVCLLGNDTPWVMARSLLPLSTLQGRGRHLGKLGNKPLGAALFRERSLKRSPIEICRSQNLWCRRSVFYVQGRPLLVAEAFLPAFRDHILIDG